LGYYGHGLGDNNKMVEYTNERFDRMFYNDMLHHVNMLEEHMKEDIPEKITSDLENIRYVVRLMMEHIEHENQKVAHLK
jgi:hypothetical protein